MPAKRKAIGPANTAPDKTPASTSLAGYDDLLHDLKERIRAEQVRADRGDAVVDRPVAHRAPQVGRFVRHGR